MKALLLLALNQNRLECLSLAKNISLIAYFTDSFYRVVRVVSLGPGVNVLTNFQSTLNQNKLDHLPLE
jgi:hypothetical protein